MIKYISKSEYYDKETGEELTKKQQERYIKIKKWRTIKKIDKTKEHGYEHVTITITYINECETNKQLKIEL